jgi:ferredoxin-NADP reductase
VLAAPDGSDLPAWEPGAHIDLHLPGGLSRQYSLCGDVHDHSTYQIGVLREPDGRGGSAYVHDTLRVGDIIEVVGPRNHFPLVDADEYVFIGGGIGITPLLPMIAKAESEGRAWSLVYGGRSAASMAFASHLVGFGDRVTLWPQDERGLIDIDAAIGPVRSGVAVYCCGPEPLISAVEVACAAWPPDTLHVERFAAPEQPERDPADEHGCELVLAASKRTLRVGSDQSVLDALDAAGVSVLSDCREGICGSCEVTVVSGAIDHRDFVLTQAERDRGDLMMVCVSRAAGARLELDL